LPADKSIETITLEDALDLFKLPRTVGQFEGSDVIIGAGRFGPYVLHDKKYVSLPKGEDPMAYTLEQAIELIQGGRKQEAERHIKSFAEDEKIEILNGRYGQYIAYDGKNYRIPKNMHDKAATLTYEECMKIVKGGK
jgi:DNA topoisomerase-1